MARNTYGLDLGSYEIKVYDKKQDTIWKEKNVLAVQDKKEIIAIGEDAYQMYEKTPPDIEVAFPMRDGVISRFNDMQNLLQNILKKKLADAHMEYSVVEDVDVMLSKGLKDVPWLEVDGNLMNFVDSSKWINERV